MACSHHGKDRNLACLSCKTIVCSTCIDEQYHDGHIFRSLENVAETVINNLTKSFDSSLNNKLETDLNEVCVRLQEEETGFDKTKQDLLRRRDQLGQLLDAVTKNFTKQLEKQRELTLAELSKFKRQTEENLLKVKDFTDRITRLRLCDNLSEVIVQGWTITVPEIVQLDFPKTNKLEFITDTSGNTDNIETFFGEVVQRDVHGQDTFYPNGGSPRPYSPSDAISVCTLDLYGDGPERDMSLATLPEAPTDISTELKYTHSSKSIKCDINLTPTCSFNVSSAAFAMRPAADGNVWLKCYKKDNIKLVGRNGVLKHCVPCNTTVSDILVSPITNQVLISCPSKKCIKRVELKQDKQFHATTTVIRTDPLAPNNMCSTMNGDILVTMTNKTSLADQPNTTSVLVKYSSKGKELTRVHKDINGRDIFHIPCNIGISNSGKVAIINGTAKFKGHLVLLDSELKLERRCIGFGVIISAEEEMPELPDRFCVNDVLFNDSNLILIAEYHSKTVQLLDPGCVPLKVLMTGCQPAPRSMAVDNDGNVWMGFNDGTISVYKYTCEFTPSET
ncbi:uncharacterized protein LOC132561171 [Ylistrum balloti]|uniref:uncharacterized protein LOC132561171 n=1 Tax=Ylistrum balloti TaxID=509963 RepID=UPI002905A5FA|nr:uncharacterized protein LOC132561171 [Ylistrum balloti]